MVIMTSLILTPRARGDDMSQAQRIQNVFNNLRGDRLEILDGFYDPQAVLVDPLGQHKGLESIRKYYQKMYRNVESIEFVYKDMISSGNKHVYVWQMRLRARGLNNGKLVAVDGNSVIEFNENNLVAFHRDYFDMNEFIYKYIPVLNWLTEKVNQQLR
jgi:hypothetical protein